MRVAVYGARGYVGAHIVEGFRDLGIDPVEVCRGDPDPGPVDILVNAACPSARYRAESHRDEDFAATVALTARLYDRVEWGRFLQVSTLSARTTHTAYGRHRRAAEALLGDDSLVVRLGPMYGGDLRKGFLLDIVNGQVVYASRSTRYSYAPVEWCGRRIAELALSSRVGMVEATGSGYVQLGEVAEAIESPSPFVIGSLYVEDQIGACLDGPDSAYVIEWAKDILLRD